MHVFSYLKQNIQIVLKDHKKGNLYNILLVVCDV